MSILVLAASFCLVSISLSLSQGEGAVKQKLPDPFDLKKSELIEWLCQSFSKCSLASKSHGEFIKTLSAWPLPQRFQFCRLGWD